MGIKPNWTKPETDYLEDSWGTVSISGISNKLGRSINAVKIKAYKLGLRRHLHAGEKVPLHQVICALGKAGGTGYFTGQLIRAGCPIKKHKVVNSSFRVVDLNEFWRWAEKHKRLFDFRNFEENALGAEPDWVKQKRAEDVRNFMRPHNCQWSNADDEALKHALLTYRYTYADLSKRLNRTEGAVKRRIHDLGIKQRPIRLENRLWTESETQTLLKLWGRGYSYERIADELGRTALQVRGKHERILNPEMSKRAYRNHKRKQEALSQAQQEF